MSTTDRRVEVFIDYSNMYIGARELFGRLGGHWGRPGERLGPPSAVTPDFGHFDPLRLAEMLVSRLPSPRAIRSLKRVHVFRGEPDRARNPELWSHFRRAVERWRADGVLVTTLPCVYRRNADRMVEKGVDVALSLEALEGAIHRRYDVAVVVSADQDLLPLIQLLAGDRFDATVEVAAWAGDGYGSPTLLTVGGVTGHRLDRQTFEEVRISNWAPARRPPVG